MPVKLLADLRRPLDPLARKNVASERPAAPQHALWLAARSRARALGCAQACRRDQLLTWTADNFLQHTVYIGLREDKPAKGVRREAGNKLSYLRADRGTGGLKRGFRSQGGTSAGAKARDRERRKRAQRECVLVHGAKTFARLAGQGLSALRKRTRGRGFVSPH